MPCLRVPFDPHLHPRIEDFSLNIVRLLTICHSEGHSPHLWDSSYVWLWATRRSPEEHLWPKVQREVVACPLCIEHRMERTGPVHGRAVRPFTCASCNRRQASGRRLRSLLRLPCVVSDCRTGSPCVSVCYARRERRGPDSRGALGFQSWHHPFCVCVGVPWVGIPTANDSFSWLFLSGNTSRDLLTLVRIFLFNLCAVGKNKTLYSWILNSIDLNCMGSLIRGFFSTNI